MAVFPGAIPTFAGFTSTHTLAEDNHAAQHNLEQAEMVQIATKLGTGSSTPSVGTILKGTGPGTSAWQALDMSTDLTGTLPVNRGGTGQTTLTDLPLVTPVLTTPVVSDFSSASHNHQNAAGGSVLDDRAIVLRNNQALEAQNSSAAATDIIKLGSDNYLRLSQIPYQANTTNSTQSNILIQTGWGFILGDTTDKVEKTVTYPVAFDTILAVIPTWLGAFAASDPTAITDFNVSVGSTSAIAAGAISITASSFQMSLNRSDLVAFGNTTRYGYSWIAIGVKA